MKIRIRESKRLNEGTIDDLRDLGDDVVNVVIKLARLRQSARDRIIAHLGGMSKKACDAMIDQMVDRGEGIAKAGYGSPIGSAVEKTVDTVAGMPLREEEIDEGLFDDIADWGAEKVDAVQAEARAVVKRELSEWLASSATTVAETVVPRVPFEKKIEKSLADTMASKSDDIAECIVSMVPILN